MKIKLKATVIFFQKWLNNSTGGLYNSKIVLSLQSLKKRGLLRGSENLQNQGLKLVQGRFSK